MLPRHLPLLFVLAAACTTGCANNARVQDHVDMTQYRTAVISKSDRAFAGIHAIHDAFKSMGYKTVSEERNVREFPFFIVQFAVNNRQCDGGFAMETESTVSFSLYDGSSGELLCSATGTDSSIRSALRAEEGAIENAIGNLKEYFYTPNPQQ